MRWVGVDVGARRKGFHVAVVGESALHALAGGLSARAVRALIADAGPAVVGIDSPRACAPAGQRVRDCELSLARELCGIRWTPDRASVNRGAYYAWVREGLALFSALADLDTNLIEVFPTASWTRWLGPRGSLSRAAWTRAGLRAIGLAGVPLRTNQDERDAIAAALTAHQHSEGATEMFGDIVVPVQPPMRMSFLFTNSSAP